MVFNEASAMIFVWFVEYRASHHFLEEGLLLRSEKLKTILLIMESLSFSRIYSA